MPPKVLHAKASLSVHPFSAVAAARAKYGSPDSNNQAAKFAQPIASLAAQAISPNLSALA
jgi:hypothetical protein